MPVLISKIFDKSAAHELSEEARSEVIFSHLFRDDGRSSYLLIDGTCRHDAVGAFDLDLLEQVPLSLLNPGNGDGISPSGAYLIDLSAMLKAMNQKRFRRFLLDPWGRQHSVVMRTPLSAQELHRHLRKFVRLERADNGKIVYLRFWDSRVAQPYFMGISNNPARFAQWLDPRGPGKIEEIIFETADPWLGWRMLPDVQNISTTPHAIRPVLTLEEITILRTAREQEFDKRTAVELSENMGNMAPQLLKDPTFGPAFICSVRQEAERRGISSERGVTRYAVASIILGFGFASDPNVAPRDGSILSSKNASEAEKLMTAKALMNVHLDDLKRRCQLVRGYLQSHQSAGLEEVFINLYPAWFEKLTEIERKGVADGFRRQSPALLASNEARLGRAAILTFIFGFHWCRNPLYRDILSELDRDYSQLTILHKRLDELDPNVETSNAYWSAVRP